MIDTAKIDEMMAEIKTKFATSSRLPVLPYKKPERIPPLTRRQPSTTATKILSLTFLDKHRQKIERSGQPITVEIPFKPDDIWINPDNQFEGLFKEACALAVHSHLRCLPRNALSKAAYLFIQDPNGMTIITDARRLIRWLELYAPVGMRTAFQTQFMRVFGIPIAQQTKKSAPTPGP